jgi:hypothetical protein
VIGSQWPYLVQLAVLLVVFSACASPDEKRYDIDQQPWRVAEAGPGEA